MPHRKARSLTGAFKISGFKGRLIQTAYLFSSPCPGFRLIFPCLRPAKTLPASMPDSLALAPALFPRAEFHFFCFLQKTQPNCIIFFNTPSLAGAPRRAEQGLRGRGRRRLRPETAPLSRGSQNEE
jgi:hypothetical protein